MEPPGGGGGSLGCERERERRRGKERREEEERDARRFKHLSRANRIDTTQPTSTHVSYGIWPVSRATAIDVTELRQYAWRNSVQRDAISCHVSTRSRACAMSHAMCTDATSS
jgi:hypothetical protein